MKNIGRREDRNMTAPAFLNMFGFLLLALSVVTVLSDSSPLCDPLTLYEDNGQCCKKCEPGKKMAEKKCLAPRCEPCDHDEYQQTYTTESKCKPQPYCDPNKNFLQNTDLDPRKKNVCMCKKGFHCSDEECMTCLPHKPCGPGEGVLKEGSHTQDTVCQKCAEGTFSNETSLSGHCVEHTKCSVGFRIGVAGTDRSDTVCVANRTHIGIIVGVVVIFIAAVIAGGFYLHRRGAVKWNPENEKKTPNVCVECIGPNGVTPQYETQDESITPMMQPQTPVENEDSSIPSMSSEEHRRSENGNIVCSVEEVGKMAHLPRQESHVSATSTISFS